MSASNLPQHPALVVFAIGDSSDRARRTDKHLSITQPYLEYLAARMQGELIVYTERPRSDIRQLPA